MRIVFATLLAALMLAAPVAARPLVGVYSEDGLHGDPTAAAGQQAAGLGVERMPFTWKGIEPERGTFNWAPTDFAVAAAALHGISVLPFLIGAPAWATGVPDSSPYSDGSIPRQLSDLADFARACIARYGPSGSFWAEHPWLPVVPIRRWQIWNEPNLPQYWRPAPSAGGYAQMLKAVYAPIKAADPGAEVIAAGLPMSSAGIPMTVFAHELYAAGARGSFDALAVHAYSADAAGVFQVVAALRGIADSSGDTGRPIWVTEFGWATGGLDSSLTVGEDEQSTLLHDALSGLITHADDWGVQGIVLFSWRDTAPPAGARDIWPFHTGLVRLDGTPKPSLAAVTSLLAPAAEPAAVAVATETPAALVAPTPTEAPAPARAAAFKLSVDVRRLRPLRVRLACSASCDAGVVLTAGDGRVSHVSGRWTRRVVAGRVARARLGLARSQRAWLADHHGARLALTVTAITAAGDVAQVTRKISRQSTVR